MVNMIYLALKQRKYNPDEWSPSLLFSEGSILLTTGKSRRFHTTRAVLRSWVFPSVLLAMLLFLYTVLVFLRIGTRDDLSQYEDEAVQASLSCTMDHSIVLRSSR